MDETGVPLEPRPPKVVARKGQKKIRYRTSGQKAQITVIGCGSAVGQILPPFIIYAAKQLNPLWTRNEVSGSRYGVSDKGWVDQELFHYWLKDHLSNAVSQRPLLLLLDGHSSHFEPQSIEFTKDNQIIIFCLPPHTTHECQPLDVGLLGTLKQHWQQACHSFYQKNATQVISKYNFCQVFRDAWLNSVIPANVCAGLKKAGVYPFNPKAIPVCNELPKDHDNDTNNGDGSHGTSDSLSSKYSEHMHTHMYAYVVAHFNLSHTTAGGSQDDGKSDNESDFGEGGEETLLGQGLGEQHSNGSSPITTGLGKYLPVISHMLMCTCVNTLLSNLDGSESTIGDLVEGLIRY